MVFPYLTGVKLKCLHYPFSIGCISLDSLSMRHHGPRDPRPCELDITSLRRILWVVLPYWLIFVEGHVGIQIDNTYAQTMNDNWDPFMSMRLQDLTSAMCNFSQSCDVIHFRMAMSTTRILTSVSVRSIPTCSRARALQFCQLSWSEPKGVSPRQRRMALGMWMQYNILQTWT